MTATRRASVVHLELHTPDVPDACGFYSALCGWREEAVPTAAGTFDVSGGSATAQLRGGFQAGDIVAVTVEQQGGSATGQI